MLKSLLFIIAVASTFYIRWSNIFYTNGKLNFMAMQNPNVKKLQVLAECVAIATGWIPLVFL